MDSHISLGNALGNVGIGLLILFAILIVGYFVFSLLTRYNDNQEIARGNEAAGIYMGAKLLGLCIIVGMVSYSSHSWLDMLIWSAVGIVVLCLVYIIFDLVTPRTKICEEIAKGNVALAQLLRSIIVGVAFVVGTFLM
ncbi:UNVERIFIED_CONTAM: putative membrane protein [Paenibacillus sp. PvR008]